MASPLIMAVILYLPSASAGCTAIASTSTSRPCSPSRYHPLLSWRYGKSRPSIKAPSCGSLIMDSSSCNMACSFEYGASPLSASKGRSISCSCCWRAAKSCSTSGCKVIPMRSVWLRESIVILSAKSSWITVFNSSNRRSIGCSSMELEVSADNSASVMS